MISEEALSQRQKTKEKTKEKERETDRQTDRHRERERVWDENKPWEGLLAVIKLVSRRVLGPQKRTSSWSPISKSMAPEIGDQCLQTPGC